MMRHAVRCCLFSMTGMLSLFVNDSVGHAQNWTRFRGDNGTGISDQQGIPVKWSPGDYAWNIELPGEGHSSPVIFKDKLFITSAIDKGAVRYLFCLNAKTGERIWARSVGFNRSRKHKESSWASATPVVDADRVYIAFADKESYTLAAYDFDGELVWRRNLGAFESQHGQGVSPILFEQLIIIPNLQKGPSSVVAFDKKSGRSVWSSVQKFYKTSYSTPIIVKPDGEQPQLICASGALGMASLNPYTGKLNWNTGEFPSPRRTVASPIYVDGLVIQTCGGGGKGNVLIAVDPSEPEKADKMRVVYTRRANLPYVPTPVGYEGHLYLWNDNGVVCCVVAKTGKTVWTKRVGGNYRGSPICIDGKLYCMTQKKGEVVVLAASPEFKLLGRSAFGDGSQSTPAVANGRLYLRSYRRLASLEAKKSP